MVSGDIGEQPLPPEPVPAPIEAEPFEDDRPNVPAESWLTPVVCVDDFDDVSALRASRADDAAPRAKNMAELQQGRMHGGRRFVRVPFLSKRRAIQKNPIKPGFPASDAVRQTRQ
jgi:hypothetical protein